MMRPRFSRSGDYGMIRVYVENSRIPRHDITRRSKFVTTVEYEAGCCRSEDRGQRQGAKAWGRGMGQRHGAEAGGRVPFRSTALRGVSNGSR